MRALLIDRLRQAAKDSIWPAPHLVGDTLFSIAADEIDRLEAINADLLDALKSIDSRLRECFGAPLITADEAYDSFYQDIVREAIAKAEGKP